jgi:hypothetical protein
MSLTVSQGIMGWFLIQPVFDSPSTVPTAAKHALKASMADCGSCFRHPFSSRSLPSLLLQVNQRACPFRQCKSPHHPDPPPRAILVRWYSPPSKLRHPRSPLLT